MKYKKGDMVFISGALELGAQKIVSAEQPKETPDLMLYNLSPKYRIGDEIYYESDLVDTNGAIKELSKKLKNIKEIL